MAVSWAPPWACKLCHMGRDCAIYSLWRRNAYTVGHMGKDVSRSLMSWDYIIFSFFLFGCWWWWCLFPNCWIFFLGLDLIIKKKRKREGTQISCQCRRHSRAFFSTNWELGKHPAILYDQWNISTYWIIITTKPQTPCIVLPAWFCLSFRTLWYCQLWVAIICSEWPFEVALVRGPMTGQHWPAVVCCDSARFWPKHIFLCVKAKFGCPFSP